MTTRRTLLALPALLGGCLTDIGPLADDRDVDVAGLTVFTTSPEEGFTAMYAEGEDAVFVDTIRTVEPTPSELHPTFLPDGTAVSIDVRFSDIEGRALIVSLTGDQMPAAWDRGVPTYSVRDVGRRPVLGALIQRAAVAIGEAGIDDDMAPELGRIASLGQTVPVTAPDHEQPPLDSEVGYCDCGPGWFFQIFQVHKQWIGWPIAEHSATSWWNCESTVGCYDYHETANHSTWASQMSVNCSNVSPWKWQGYESYQSAGSCDDRSGYALCGLWGGNHNCHDDTKVQLKRILCGYTPNVCSGAGCDTHAPDYCGC